MHFDNTFPLVSPGAYSAVRARGLPVVQSLRNYRLLCPSATFFRDGHVCEDCLGRTPPWPGIRHRCYRGSRGQTAIVATMLTAHRLRRTWLRDVDYYIALTAFSRQKFIEGGLPADRVVVKPNFVALPPPVEETARTGMLYVGRLSAEKGIATMLRAWERAGGDISLRIVDDGPLTATVAEAAAAIPTIHALGRRREEDTYALMAEAQALILPSEWYETFGRVAVEAFACGTPVIASRLGAMAEIVEDGVTGLLFTPGDAEDLEQPRCDGPGSIRRRCAGWARRPGRSTRPRIRRSATTTC